MCSLRCSSPRLQAGQAKWAKDGGQGRRYVREAQCTGGSLIREATRAPPHTLAPESRGCIQLSMRWLRCAAAAAGATQSSHLILPCCSTERYVSAEATCCSGWSELRSSRVVAPAGRGRSAGSLRLKAASWRGQCRRQMLSHAVQHCSNSCCPHLQAAHLLAGRRRQRAAPRRRAGPAASGWAASTLQWTGKWQMRAERGRVKPQWQTKRTQKACQLAVHQFAAHSPPPKQQQQQQ